jgi:DNA-binding SARP family transcriptional activator
VNHPQTFNGNLSGTLPPVAISVLGSFRLTLDGNAASIINESKSEHLLICLALARQHRMLRTHLLERIWPQSEHAVASQCLSSLTYQLNKLTGEFLNGVGIIAHENGYYRLNPPDSVWIDVDHFDAWSEMGKRLLAGGDLASGVVCCEQALALYQGDLCGDSGIQTVIERERLRIIFLDLLDCLADHYFVCGDYTKALSYIQRLLEHDPCYEDAHRQAMYCYVRLGRRAQALRQYHICCLALASEFDARPEQATVILFDQIRLDPTNL